MTERTTSISRRQLITLAGALLTGSALAKAQGDRGGGATNAQSLTPDTIAVVQLDPNSPGAVALGYYDNHRQVDTARWMKKATDAEGKQRCATCALYQPIDEASGDCRIFSGKRVAANGWCNAWTGE